MNDKVNFPANALPLDAETLDRVQQFDSKALYWLSGYCSGLADAKGDAVGTARLPSNQSSVSAKVALKTVVLYASESGNAEKIAETLHSRLSGSGIDAQLASVADFKTKELKQQQIILMVASTHGEGEPPDDAIDFHEFVLGKRAPKLAGVKYAVLSLGDSSYEFFCQTGKDFDRAFNKLGAESLLERVDCDLDYESQVNEWTQNLVAKISELQGSTTSASEEVASSTSAPLSTWTKQKPFSATVLANQVITGRGSVKHINHIELSLEGSEIHYQPGDSLGVWAKNEPLLVKRILEVVGLTGEESVSIKDETRTVQQALTENLELTLLNKGFISDVAELAGSEELKDIADNQYSDFIQNHQVVDVLEKASTSIDAQKLVELLKPIKPRMYSIASSLEANPEEVHLTVGLAESQNDSTTRYGAASYFLIEALKEDDEVLVFVDENKHFKLPEGNKPTIMIGPGTGIAPFRAFLQERQELGANGENWLFFGNPNFNTDFLYQVELQELIKEGVLSNLSVAFSRDQEEKVYVQDRLLENSESIWNWLDVKDASLYVCGDMSRMAKDVEQALLTIIQEQGNKSEEQAKDYLKALRKSKRYQRDVY